MELGDKVRTLRQQKAMALEVLSRRAGVSKSILSLIERNISTPTVRTLEKIVKPLGTTVSELCHEMESIPREGVPKSKPRVLRRRERKKLLMGPERGKARYELLTPDYRGRLQIIYIHFPVGKRSSRFVTHEGEEWGMVLEGLLKVVIDRQEFVLQEGDSICFDSTLPHSLENIGEIEVRAFWVNTPPTF